MKLRLESVQLQGFLSFVEPTYIEFPKEGLILLEGASGSGKTSILMAAAYCGGFADRPATELQSWYSDSMSVTLTLTDEINKWAITRSPKLSIKHNGEKVPGSAKDLEKYIADLFGNDPELVEVLTFRMQRTNGQFVRADDEKRKSLLTNLLQLKEVEDAGSKVTKELSSKNQELEVITASIGVRQSAVSSMAFIENDYQRALQELEALQALVDTSAATGDLAQKSIYDQITAIDIELQKIEPLKNELARLPMQISQIRENCVKTQHEITTLQGHKCATCEQTWNDAKSVDRLSQLQAFLSEQAGRGSEAVARKAYLEQNTPDTSELLHRKAELSAGLQGLTRDKSQLMATYRAKESEYSQIVTRRRDLGVHTSKLADALKTKSELEQQIAELTTLKEIFGKDGFLSAVFDEVLAEIEWRANMLIARIPNVALFTLSINSATMAKNGNEKRSISLRLFKDGFEATVKSLSGGQQSAVELCVDLALMETIRARSGSRLGWVCLDEAMDGLGALEKEAAIEIIKQSCTGQVFVIEHESVIKEMFEIVISVEYDGKVSRVS